MRINFSNMFHNIFYILFVALIFIVNVSCVERTHFNESIRGQVKQFLNKHLNDFKIASPESNEAILHLFNGLSLYNDHFRFGGILDYCEEHGLLARKYKQSKFEFNVNNELLNNVHQYINCVDNIYVKYLDLNITLAANTNNNVKDSHLLREFMHAFLLTKPVYLARELAKFLKKYNTQETSGIWSDDTLWFYNLKLNFLMDVAATQTTEELRLIRQLIIILTSEERGIDLTKNIDFNTIELFEADKIPFLNQRGFDSDQVLNFVNNRFGGNEQQNNQSQEQLQFMRIDNIEQWKILCTQIFPNFSTYHEMVSSRNTRQILFFRAGCSLLMIKGEIQIDYNSYPQAFQIITKSFITAAIMTFSQSAYKGNNQTTTLDFNNITTIFRGYLDSFAFKQLKNLNFRVFDLEKPRFFTNFDQIDYFGLPQYKGQSFKTNQIFENLYNWIDDLCPINSPWIGKNELCLAWLENKGVFKTLVDLGLGTKRTEDINSILLYAIKHVAKFVNFLFYIARCFATISNIYNIYKKSQNVQDNVIEFANIGLARNKVTNFDPEKDELFTGNLANFLNDIYRGISETYHSDSSIQPFTSRIELEYQMNAELGRIALEIYTLNGLAHLVHVAWPIANYIIKENTEFTKDWLETRLTKFRRGAENRKNQFFEPKIDEGGASTSTSRPKQKAPLNQEEEEEEKQKEYNNIWFWSYLSLKENQFDFGSAEKFKAKKSSTLEIQQYGAGPSTSQPPRRRSSSGCGFLNCFKASSTRDKRSVENVFLEKIIRNKRMIQRSPLRTPPRQQNQSKLTYASIWFGYKLFMFGLGWVLQALQYEPLWFS